MSQEPHDKIANSLVGSANFFNVTNLKSFFTVDLGRYLDLSKKRFPLSGILLTREAFI